MGNQLHNETEQGKPPPVLWHPGNRLISPRNALVLSGVLLGMLIIGSIWDLQISQALYNPRNPLGIFGAAYGELPAGMALLVAGTLLIVFRSKERLGVRVGQVVGGGLLYIVGAGMVLYLPTRYLSWPILVVVLIGVVIVAATSWGVVVLAHGASRRLAIRVALALFIVVLTELILINIIKIGWERPRMRFISETDAVGFSPWWSPGTPERDALVAGGVEAEEFKSFPSGHTANATLAIMATALIPLRASLEKWSNLLFWGGAVWGIYVGFSRIIMGAHFVSDTVVGFTVTFVIILIAYRLIFPPSLSETSEYGNLDREQAEGTQL